MVAGGQPAGSSRALRLDPFALPVRFAASDEAADERVRHRRTRSRTRGAAPRGARHADGGGRAGRGLPGVAVRMLPPKATGAGTVAVMLEHRDPGAVAAAVHPADGDEIVAEWQSWGRVLGLPLLVADLDGTLREPFERIGALPSRRRNGGAAAAARFSAAARILAARRRGCRRCRRASRRARNHRAELSSRSEPRCAVPRRAPAPRTGSARHRGST